MALVVEDGTGLSTADSYCSLASALAYHAKFGNTAWAALASDAVREVLLLKATRYVDTLYALRVPGNRLTTTQALLFPRYAIYYPDGLLIDYTKQLSVLVMVCSELALKANTEDIYTDLSNSGVVASESNSVGSISTSKTYVNGRSPIKVYRLIDDMMSPLLSNNSMWGEVIRS